MTFRANIYILTSWMSLHQSVFGVGQIQKRKGGDKNRTESPQRIGWRSWRSRPAPRCRKRQTSEVH